MLTFSDRGTPPADRLLVVFSDIEMGAGGREDDFPHSDFLGELILSYNDGPGRDLAIDLIFNGDTFDLLKTSYLGEFPRHISAGKAMGKMSQVASAHPRFFEAVRLFLGHRRAERRVHFVTGNHDAELAFPEVQQLISALCGGGPIYFPGLSLRIGEVEIEHGAQLDPLFRVPPERPFAEYGGEPVLSIGFASAAMLDTVMKWHPQLCVHDRLKPKRDAFEVMPELKELLVGAMWRYWTHDYWKGWLGTADPTKRLSWKMVKEILYRFSSHDVEVSMGSVVQERLQGEGRALLYLLGHQHEAGWWSFGDRKVLQTGALRNEYMLKEGGKVLKPIAKVYAEVFMREGEPVRSHLVEIDGPPPPAGYLPESIFNILPWVREQLGSQSERRRQQADQEAQERREEKERRR